MMKRAVRISMILTIVQIFVFNVNAQDESAENSFKEVVLNMALTEADSIKTVTVTAHTFDNGQEVPVSGETVSVFVPRMFSNFIIGELSLDEAGTASIEFPSDLPGGKDGNLTIVAAFIDNSTYGNVEKREVKHWGIPTDYLPASHRALWTQRAPSWMIYTLSVLLAGVWGHYMFAVISLIRIKINANKLKAKAEYKQ
jgi:hypothetical protein